MEQIQQIESETRYQIGAIDGNEIEGLDRVELSRLCAKFGYSIVEDGIATIAVENELDDHWLFSTGSYSSLRASVESCLANDDVKAMALLINSPGGSVLGLFECCEYLRKAQEQKPIHAHVTGQCCSAAYAIACACTDISATETSQVGSIGILSRAKDYTGYDEKRGIISKIFRSKHAQHKVESPLTEVGAKDVQEKLDFYESKFYDLISASRREDVQKCIDTYGNGAVFLAEEAYRRGMVDRIVSYEDFMGNLISSPSREEEEEYMDISKLSAEERADLFKALVEAEPSLAEGVAETAKAEERERITSLLSNRTEASASLIDAAVADGRKVGEIAMDLLAIERQRADELALNAVNPMEAIAQKAQAQQNVVPPAPTAANLTERERIEAEASEAARRVLELRNKEVAHA